MDHQLLEETIDVLKNIRMEIHDNAEDSVIRQLDQIIKELEANYADDAYHEIDPKDILFYLGWIIKHLPKFIDVFEKMFEYLDDK